MPGARKKFFVNPDHVPDNSVRISDFGGFRPNADPHDIPPGVSIRQVNAMSWKPGELRVRPGFAVVKFDA